jgi:hypothetical protein
VTPVVASRQSDPVAALSDWPVPAVDLQSQFSALNSAAGLRGQVVYASLEASSTEGPGAGCIRLLDGRAVSDSYCSLLQGDLARRDFPGASPGRSSSRLKSDPARCIRT